MKINRFIAIILAVSLLLLIPFIAMQFTNEVNWDITDFTIAGILLFSTGLALEFAIRKVKNKQKLIVICIAIIITLMLIWIELAVGIFGTPFAGS